MSREVPVRAVELAARLSALFTRDVEIVKRLADAQRRLCVANERLWAGVSPDAFGLAYDRVARAGNSEVARLMDGGHKAGGPDVDTAVLGWAIHRAFVDYQNASEERRQLAVDVGELAQQLIGVLCASGWSEEAARSADVHKLAAAAATLGAWERSR
jgi:hypothetical protein